MSNYYSMVNKFLVSWRKSLPSSDEHTRKLISDFSQYMDQRPCNDQQTLLSHIDFFVENLTPTDFQLLELYCQFLVSRGVLSTNPFLASMEGISSLEYPVRQSAQTERAFPLAIIPKELQMDWTELESRNPIPSDLLLALDEHFNWRLNLKQIAEGSVSSYRTDLQQFLSFLHEQGLTLTSKSIETWALHLAVVKIEKPVKNLKTGESEKVLKDLSRKTISRKKNSVRAYLSKEIFRNHLFLNPTYLDFLQTTRKDKTPEQPHVALSLDDLNRIMHYLATQDLRTQLEFLMMLLCGPRADETIRIQAWNCDFSSGVLDLIKTKNGCPRKIPFPPFLEAMLKKYIDSNQFSFNDYIFPTRQSNHLSRKTLTAHVQNIAASAGLKRPVTSHDLRATFANLQFFHNQTDPNTLMEWMAHEDINTLFGYVGKQLQSRKPDLRTLYHEWATILGLQQSATSSKHKVGNILQFVPVFKSTLAS